MSLIYHAGTFLTINLLRRGQLMEVTSLSTSQHFLDSYVDVSNLIVH